MLIIEPDVLRRQIDNYFEQVRINAKFTVGLIEYDEPYPSLTGMAIFLGFSSVSHFKVYLERPEYTEHIEYALLRIENRYEQLLQRGVSTAKSGLRKVGDWSDDAVPVQVVTNVQQNSATTHIDLEDRRALIASLRKPKVDDDKPQP